VNLYHINYTLPQIIRTPFLSQNETITLPEHSLRPSRCMHRHHPLQHVHHNNTAKFDEISILHNNGYLINKPAFFSDEGNSLAAARESAWPTKPGQELLRVIVTQVNEGYRRMNLLRLRTCDWIQNSKLHGSRRVIREL